MKILVSNLRKQLERTVIEARDVAEAGARVALEALAVQHHEPYGHMDTGQRTLRRRLRAHARQLGDRLNSPRSRGEGAGVRAGSHGIDHLIHECAYEHWHGMLFARFLAENQLLIEPEMGVAITLDECEELARDEGIDKWALAARYAHRMLPQVFRPDHPVFEVQFAREHRLKLEGLVEGVPSEVFTATDALGWVYQFWQTKRKDEVNRSEVKIGANELPAVTQLFTEPYMVQFLLHNSLGAWWFGRHTDKTCPVDLAYLRRAEDGVPAAGEFEGWPDNLEEFRLLDPCCGSGHFMVAAFLMLTPMRMALEGLDATQAVDAVLRENLHGLELDQRCVAIAAFALALEAWRFPDAGGFRTLPKLNLAWCGQPVAGKKEQWLALAEGDSRLEAGMTALYDTFRDAPTLGSLIDPARSVSEDMLTADFQELQPLLQKALMQHAREEELEETAIAALGLADAASLLGNRYHLIATNVPFKETKQLDPTIQRFIDTRFSAGKANLATAFILRIKNLLVESGSVSMVTPHEWLFLKTYEPIRKVLLRTTTWNLLADLGEGAFDSPQAAGAFTALISFSNIEPNIQQSYSAFDLVKIKGRDAKAKALQSEPGRIINQSNQYKNPDHRIGVFESSGLPLLREYAGSFVGLQNGDTPRFVMSYWELANTEEQWEFFQMPCDDPANFNGLEAIVRWEGGKGALASSEQARVQGVEAWGKHGVAIRQTRTLPATLYLGPLYDQSSAAIIPKAESDMGAVWAYCSSPEFHDEVRKIDKKKNVTNATLVKVPFDRSRWQRIAKQEYPNGLPKPYTNNSTQWIFHGHPCGSVVWDGENKKTDHGSLREDATVLQISAIRLLGYHWPAENDPDMELADQQRTWVDRTKALYQFEDEDGIVCIPSVRGERPAHERIQQLLHVAYSDDWNDGILTKLLAESSCTSVDDWLRNKFFDEHCKLFQHRPFIWHIWDGRKRDGFHALVNYHKLAEGEGKGRRLLESLTYSYLGDWIARQQDGVKRGEGGAEDRLAAALELQKRLVAILEGEPPFDIFVRWKPIEEQPIGWEPDINDGVRLNIRPFMAQDIPGGKKGAGILRAKPNIHWRKDRGKEPMRDQDQFPWFWKNGRFTGERVNDVHLTNAEKRVARTGAGK